MGDELKMRKFRDDELQTVMRAPFVNEDRLLYLSRLKEACEKFIFQQTGRHADVEFEAGPDGCATVKHIKLVD